MTYPGSRYRANLWFLVPVVSSEGTLNIGPIAPSDCPTGYVALIEDDARETRVSRTVACIPWFGQMYCT
jgi:hypothetical protein